MLNGKCRPTVHVAVVLLFTSVSKEGFCGVERKSVVWLVFIQAVFSWLPVYQGVYLIACTSVITFTFTCWHNSFQRHLAWTVKFKHHLNLQNICYIITCWLHFHLPHWHQYCFDLTSAECWNCRQLLLLGQLGCSTNEVSKSPPCF